MWFELRRAFSLSYYVDRGGRCGFFVDFEIYFAEINIAGRIAKKSGNPIAENKKIW